jgi:hypothetical protein
MNGLGLPLGRAALAVPVLVFSLAVPALADDPAVARISVLNGDAVVKRADSGDLTAAAINAPLMAGDFLTTQNNGRAEVEFDSTDAVRIGNDTQLRLNSLDQQTRSIALAQGTVELRVLAASETYPAIQTPSVTVQPNRVGAYRVSVLDDGSVQVTVRLGEADVNSGTSDQLLDPGSTLAVSTSAGGVQFQTTPMIAIDDFDTWNADRDHVAQTAQSYQYVDAGVVGADDLDAYGRWVDAPGYGHVWSPYVAANWAPYTYGRWVWEPYYGWTWVAAEPWGWAPYHYGRWFYNGAAGWCWVPDNVHPLWRPALVAFFSFGGTPGGFRFGFGNIGWVPLGPREPFHPWWGNGWSNGYHHYETGITTVTTVTPVTTVTRGIYRNFRAPGGAVFVSQRRFALGDFSHPAAVSNADLVHVNIVSGAVPVVPTQHNLVIGGRPASTAVPSERFTHFVAPPAAPSFDQQRRYVQTVTTAQYHTDVMRHTGIPVQPALARPIPLPHAVVPLRPTLPNATQNDGSYQRRTVAPWIPSTQNHAGVGTTFPQPVGVHSAILPVHRYPSSLGAYRPVTVPRVHVPRHVTKAVTVKTLETH